ncbi:SlyX family protein [Paracoccus homiensis]|uniref:SlyX protein n=1 Tax=Paracoccus homiensis TaxID=364199 RepID=A0A1I0F4H1_9RHOB|nr:SlyX family protein [Paracoccus homiensis]SET52723.1 SlyX protein [Paracoccus homiensis]
MDKKTEPRLLALEETVAHLSRVTDDLSEVIARQDRIIDRISKRLQMLVEAEAQRQADDSGTIPLADQRPPHY